MFKDPGWGLKIVTCLAPFLDSSPALPENSSITLFLVEQDEHFLISVRVSDCKLLKVKSGTSHWCYILQLTPE